MINMKMSDEERAEYGPTAMTEQPLYPWGLRISLDDDALKKLGIKDLPSIDQVVTINCKAQVVAINSNKSSDDETEDRVDFQITEMEIEQASGKSAAQKLYGA